MILEISDKARAFLKRKKASEVTVGLIIAGCCVEVGEPNVTIGKPKDEVEKYDIFDMDDYTVYFFKNPSLKDGTVVIDTSKFIGIESLSVKGLKYF